MRAIRSVAVMLGICLVVPACTSLSPSKERASEVYAAIVEWFAASTDNDDTLKVFVEPRGEGSSVSVDVQAELISAVEDVATVRFIDARDEALEEGDDGQLLVRENGVLLAFDPVPTDAVSVSVEVDQYLNDSEVRVHTFELGKVGGTWRIDGHTVVDEPIIAEDS